MIAQDDLVRQTATRPPIVAPRVVAPERGATVGDESAHGSRAPLRGDRRGDPGRRVVRPPLATESSFPVL